MIFYVRRNIDSVVVNSMDLSMYNEIGHVVPPELNKTILLLIASRYFIKSFINFVCSYTNYSRLELWLHSTRDQEKHLCISWSVPLCLCIVYLDSQHRIYILLEVVERLYTNISNIPCICAFVFRSPTQITY